MSASPGDYSSKPRFRGVGAATDRVVASGGQRELLKRRFDRNPVPMVVVDDERRYVDVNGPGRLAFRLTLAELRERRIDDLTPPHLFETMAEAWARLIATGCVAGDYEVAVPDGSALEIVYLATAEVMPGLHLIAFAPAAWPEGELFDDQEDIDPAGARALTPRELQILELAADGRTAPAIADELVVSPATVRTHFENIYAKLGVRGRAAAVARAMRLGLIA